VPHATLDLSLSGLIFSRWTWVSQYRNVPILDFIGAKDDGDSGDNWSFKTCKAPVKSSPPTNKHPTCLQAGCPSYRPTNSVKALNGKHQHWNQGSKEKITILSFAQCWLLLSFLTFLNVALCASWHLYWHLIVAITDTNTITNMQI